MAAAAPTPRILILPGLSNSGPTHWQSVWEAADPSLERVQQRDWDNPDAEEWQQALDAHIRAQDRPTILVAHSLSCSLAVRWAAAHADRPAPVVAALLVAPADVESEAHTPPETRSFAPFPRGRLAFACEVIASRNDPYVDFARARALAADWGAHFTDAGELGHINSASNLGSWPLGRERLAALIARAGVATPS